MCAFPIANAKVTSTVVAADTNKRNLTALFLSAMLLEKYNVLVTPASYNTPMGISKTVNGLDTTYDVFAPRLRAPLSPRTQTKGILPLF